MRDELRDYGKVVAAAKKLVGTKEERDLVPFFLGLVLTILIGNLGAPAALEYVSEFTNKYVARLKKSELIDDSGNPADPK